MTARRGPPATRQNLLGTSRRLGKVTRGIGLLRRKREALVGELFRLARPAAQLRRTLAERADAAWSVLLDGLAIEGQTGLRALGWPAHPLSAELRAGQVWGIPVVEILRHTAVRRTLAARGTPPGAAGGAAIRTGTAFEELTEVLLEAAGREALLRRLGEALARTSRQVNTLERRIGPELRGQIAGIRRTLDEREREEHLRLERLRSHLASRRDDP
jgi:V/A-type H+-transporting ATPase subunit D